MAPDSHAAARALWHRVIWRKRSLGKASEAGSRFVERLLSVAETAASEGRPWRVLSPRASGHRAGATDPLAVGLIEARAAEPIRSLREWHKSKRNLQLSLGL